MPAQDAGNITSAINIGGLCDTLKGDISRIVLTYIRGVLTISCDNVRYEFFSAVQSQGCSEEWMDDLHKKWFKLTPYKRDALIKRVSMDGNTISISELMEAL